ncbi:MAG: hypothetical protein ABI333_08700 [bacterium]
MSWTRRAATVVMALAGAFCLVFAGCGGDDEDYACDTGCTDLADRWDDCSLDFSVLPDRVGSESSARNLCIQKLGENVALPSGQTEATKIETCERISADIAGLYCAELQRRVTEAAKTTWLDVMKAVFE